MPEKYVKLLFGEGNIDLRVLEKVSILDMKKVEPLPDPEGAIYAALAEPIESPPLMELARGRATACVVISDITRPVPNKVILPPLLEVLEASGIDRENIIILIATGMHRPNEGEELESMVGRQILDNYRIVNHYCRKPGVCQKIAEIEGAPIEVNKHYLDADLKILTGLIEPHFYAGYSGGRKAILPGISSFQTMKFMHSYKMIDHPKVTNCLLEGNPLHEHGIRVTEIALVDFILNVVINNERKVAGVFAGHYNHAHLAGCEWVYQNCTVALDSPADLVITSGGGYPLDATFIQMSKALICAKDILKKGGTILIACQCREGLGSSEFRRILRSVGGPQEFFETYSIPENFVIDQWGAQNIYQAMDHADKVFVYSPGLSHEDLEMIGAAKIENIQETVHRLLSSHEKVVVIPDGPYVVGMINGII